MLGAFVTQDQINIAGQTTIAGRWNCRPLSDGLSRMAWGSQ